MYLKSLVLKGFKSFADRSVLSMEPGITAVVGPNGSGKSNISDAVLWVLGERNAKHLRGQAMEDVIFSGSSARKSVGIAEVDLVLDNTDATLSVDYSEVVITRRMYRSGESEYLINGVLARRMDVLDILHDSGLGSHTHSIISQGSLDTILQSKPSDRRELIEEAAGVLKHKQRKAKSERKLLALDTQISRVKDIEAEVARQLGPLERKAKRARAYEIALTQLNEATLVLAVDDLRSLQAQWEAVRGREAQLKDILDKRRWEVEQSQAAAQKLQKHITQSSIDEGELLRCHRQVHSVAERLERVVLLLREKKSEAQSSIADLEASNDRTLKQRLYAEQEKAQSQAQLNDIRSELKKVSAYKDSLEQQRSDTLQERGCVEREVEELEKTCRQDERTCAQVKQNLSQAQELCAQSEAHLKLIDTHRSELTGELKDIQVHLDEQTKRVSCIRLEIKNLASEQKELQSRVDVMGQSREGAQADFDAAREAAVMLVSNIKGLEEVERASTAANTALTWLVDQTKDTFASGFAPLAHCLRTPKEWESLVERILGNEVSAQVVNDKAAIESLTEALMDCGKDGEVVLIPARDLSENSHSTMVPAREADHAGLGVALIDMLTYPRKMAGSFEALLGDVVIVESRDALFAACQRDRWGVRFVSKDGCIMWPSGKVSVGTALAESSEGVLARARHLDELRAQRESADTRCLLAQERLNCAERDLGMLQTKSLELSQKCATVQGTYDSSIKELAHHQEKLASAQRELQTLDTQRTEIEQKITRTQPGILDLEKSLHDLQQGIEKATAKLDTLHVAFVPLRKRSAQIRDELTEAKLKQNTLIERETYALRLIDAKKRDMASIDRSTQEAQDKLTRKLCSKKRIEPLLNMFKSVRAQASAWADNLERTAQTAQSSMSELHAQVEAARVATQAAHDAFDEVQNQISEVRVEHTRLEIQVQAAISVIVKDCNTPLDQALIQEKLQNRSQQEQEVFSLRRRIAQMGTINPDAAKEYDVLKDRHDYLCAQISDLEGARRTLFRIVQIIDKRMKDDFMRTFDIVNQNFQEIFGILFPGGVAHLSLDDSSEEEDSGVEVSAQPRGKRISKMMLLSGGEKSLTALALLFAVYRIRSTPFYILDEVEAALDDSNLHRLGTYLQTLRNETQLIMITHQRRTMEMADVLFGVSMNADGVTKVVSQKLASASTPTT